MMARRSGNNVVPTSRGTYEVPISKPQAVFSTSKPRDTYEITTSNPRQTYDIDITTSNLRTDNFRTARPIYDVPSLPPSPPPYDRIYEASTPYVPRHGGSLRVKTSRAPSVSDVTRPLSDIVRPPRDVVRPSECVPRYSTLRKQGSYRSYVDGDSPGNIAETSFTSQRSSVHVNDSSGGNTFTITQQRHLDRTTEGLLCVRMAAGTEGRYGFRVRGGADLGRPITVGRILPGGPADLEEPKVRIGDQILFINGVQVSNSTHNDVVALIRSSSETVGELFLVVKRQWPYNPHDVDKRSSISSTLSADRHEKITPTGTRERTDFQYQFLGNY